jgi:hypothetical protein
MPSCYTVQYAPGRPTNPPGLCAFSISTPSKKIFENCGVAVLLVGPMLFESAHKCSFGPRENITGGKATQMLYALQLHAQCIETRIAWCVSPSIVMFLK